MKLHKKTVNCSHFPLTTPLLLLGMASIIIVFFIGIIGYFSTFAIIDKIFQQAQLNKAKQLAIFAKNFNKGESDQIKLKNIESFWAESSAKPDDEYICIIDEDSNLILHSKAPQYLGKNAGKNLITGGNIPGVKCLADLTTTPEDYVGGYISSAGENQIASFVHIPGKNWILGLHRSKKALHSEVRSKIHYLLIAIIVLCGVLLLSSLSLLCKAALKSQKKEQESEKRYRSVVQDLPILICRNTPDGIIEFVNDAYCKYFGKSREDLIGNNFYNFIPEEDRDMVRSNLASLSTKKPVKIHEHKVINADGIIFYHRWTNRAIFDNSGKVLILQGFGEDITKQKETEEKIKQLSKFPNENPNPVMRISPDGILLYANNSCTLILKTWNIKEHDKLPKKWIKLIAEIFKSGGNTIFDEEINDSTFSFTISPIKDMKYVNVYGMDITERIVAEKTLHESEKRFRNAILSAPLPAIIHAEDGEVIAISDEWTTLTGYKHSDIPTIEEWLKKAYVKESIPEIHSIIKKLYQIDSRVHEGEFIIRTKENNSRVWDFYSSPLGTASSKQKLVLSMAVDITEEKKIKEELTKHRENLEELVKERTQELNTMVNAMSGREVRMAELKEEIKQLHSQLEDTGLTPKEK